jgi:DNA repair ATPase RecN
VLIENLERASGADPSVGQWREAMTQSTGARLRAALEANEGLARELAEVKAAADRNIERLTFARSQLTAANERIDQADRLCTEYERELAAAHDEIEELRAKVAHRPGPYWLTPQGMAATEPQPEPGEDR